MAGAPWVGLLHPVLPSVLLDWFGACRRSSCGRRERKTQVLRHGERERERAHPPGQEEKENTERTSRERSSSISSMWTTWPILGRFWASGSTQRSATRRTRFSALGGGALGSLGSTTCSALRSPTRSLSQSTRFTFRQTTRSFSSVHQPSPEP